MRSRNLRESQQGPSAVLREIKARFDSVPGLYLKSLEQKDGELTIKGISPNESSVTRFGQSLEFSSGLFTNLNIETQREVGRRRLTRKRSLRLIRAVCPTAGSCELHSEVQLRRKASSAKPAANPAANQVAMKK